MPQADASVTQVVDSTTIDTMPCLPEPLVAIPYRRADSLWAAIDAHALAAPPDVEDSAHTLAHYLVAPARNDWDKFRAIFTWIADRIRYDDAAYNSGVYGLRDITTIFKSRRGVCEDYANLFDLLALQAGLQSKKVIGFSKGFSSLLTKNSLEPDHAWNAFKIDSTWHLIDVTWAAGYGQMQGGWLHTTKRFEGYWFDTPPEEFIFTHLPSEGQWQLLPQTLSVADFDCLPLVNPEYFKLGYAAAPLIARLDSGASYDLPRVYTHSYQVQPLDIPAERHLKKGDSLQLRYLCHDCQGMTALSAGRLVDFERTDSLFCLDLVTKKGPLRVFGRRKKSARQWDGIMEWVVR